MAKCRYTTSMFFNTSLFRKRVYLDYASAMPISKSAQEAMRKAERVFGNPSSVHQEGLVAKQFISAKRSEIAETLLMRAKDLVFTSGGTESNNIAIFGVLRKAIRMYGNVHAITSEIEHPSVLEVFQALEREGVRVTYISVGEDGRIDPQKVTDAIQENTVCVSVALVNGEIGTIQPIRDIARALAPIRERRGRGGMPLVMHTDASQAPLYMSVSGLGVDLMTLDSGKVAGPKGIGLLYIKNKEDIEPLFYGGGQELSVRPGTESAMLVAGFAAAMVEAHKRREARTEEVKKLQEHMFSLLEKYVPDAEVNGSLKHRIANNINISLRGTDAEFMVIRLDTEGVACGSRSACQSKEEGSSYVVNALGKGVAYGASSLRFSLSEHTTKQDIEYAVRILQKLHASPLEVSFD